MSPDPDVDAEFREIRGILLDTVKAVNLNSLHISELIMETSRGREAAVAQVKQFTTEAVETANRKLVWFLVGAVILSALGERALAVLAKVVGIP